MGPSYSDYVTSIAHQNPSLNILSDFLRQQPRTPCNSNVSYVEIEASGDVGPPQETSTSQIIDRLASGLKRSTIAVIENIHPDDIESLGSYLDIDPFFFCGHIASSYGNIEKDPLPPLLALPPSRLISGTFFNIHYGKVLDLGDDVILSHVPYEVASLANVSRRVRRLPALSGRSIGILRACTSLIKKDLPGGIWISLILIDRASDIVVHPIHNITRKFVALTTTQIPRGVAIEAFHKPPTYAEHQSKRRARHNGQSSNPGIELLSLFHTLPPGWRAGNPNILSLSYYLVRAAIQEWILYGLLMGRYVKYYEYSSRTVESRLESFEKDDIIDLHRWRRRSLQSLHKIDILRRFVEHWASKEGNLNRNMESTVNATRREESVAWNLLIGDIKYLEEHITQHARSLETLNPIITALVQLVDSKRAIAQAEDTRRLTYIAIVFLPMSFITGVFGMSEPYGPGNGRFWIYWVVALPITGFVIGSLALDLRFGFLSTVWARMQKRVTGS